MSTPRLYLDQPLAEGAEVPATAGQAHYLGAVKRDAMDWMAEKATELGIGLIQPVLTRRSITDKVNIARLSSIAQEAAEQCGRLTVPRVAPAAPLHAVL